MQFSFHKIVIYFLSEQLCMLYCKITFDTAVKKKQNCCKLRKNDPKCMQCSKDNTSHCHMGYLQYIPYFIPFIITAWKVGFNSINFKRYLCVWKKKESLPWP